MMRAYSVGIEKRRLIRVARATAKATALASLVFVKFINPPLKLKSSCE